MQSFPRRSRRLGRNSTPCVCDCHSPAGRRQRRWTTGQRASRSPVCGRFAPAHRHSSQRTRSQRSLEMVEAVKKRAKPRDPNRLVGLEDLKLIVAVADARAFRRVARMLGVEPSSVSRRIRAVEDRVGVSLFERYRTGARLTGAGELFLHDIRGALAQIEYAAQALREAGVGANGAVTVGITAGLASAPLSSLLTLYRADHPAVRIELIEGMSGDINLGFMLARAPDGCG